MPAGVMRILPFAAISAVLHAAVLMNMPEGVDIAVTPDGHANALAVRLVPSGATTPDPAAQSGVAGSKPESSHQRNEQPGSALRANRGKKTTVAESHRPSDPGGTERDSRQVASGGRTTTEAAPNDTDQKHAGTVATEKNETSRASGTITDRTEGSNKLASAAETGTSSTPDAPETSGASAANETRESVQPDEASAARAARETADVEAPDTKPDDSEATEGDMQAGKQADAEGTFDRTQLASHARQQVQIHFRDQFRYPRIARQRGWEGRVVLTFRLQPDGRITDVEVSESSGRSLLDENARETLLRIRRVPEVNPRLAGRALALEVPVAYRLVPANTQRVAGAR